MSAPIPETRLTTYERLPSRSRIFDSSYCKPYAIVQEGMNEMLLLAHAGHFVSERNAVYSVIKNRAEERL